MGLLLLKLLAVGLDWKLVYILQKTFQDMVLDSYLQQTASNQVTLSDVFNLFFEITSATKLAHYFFLAKYVLSKIA